MSRQINNQESFVRLLNSDGTDIDSSNKLPVDATLTLSESTSSVQIFGNDGSSNQAIATNSSGHTLVAVQTQPNLTASDIVSANMRDGSGNSISSTSNALHVDVQNSSIVVSATALDTRALTSSDVVTAQVSQVPVLSSHGNIVDNTTLNGNSTSVDTQYVKELAVIGNVSGAVTLKLQGSADNTNFYDMNHSITTTAAGNVHLEFSSAMRYIRVNSSASITATLSLSGKA